MRPFDQLNEEEVQELVDRAKFQPPQDNKQEKCDRLTAHLSIAHQGCGHEITSVGVTFDTFLANKEQPYKRYGIKIGVQPITLDLGWLVSVGYIVVENKRTLAPRPSNEQRQEHTKHRVYVLVDETPIFAIAPGQLFAVELFSKETIDRVAFSSSSGDCLINVTAFPT